MSACEIPTMEQCIDRYRSFTLDLQGATMSKIIGPDVPLIGQKPRLRVEHIPVANLVMSDADGDAELKPQDDITIVELYKIMLLMAWILGTPPIPQPDPQTGGKSLWLRALKWRQFIADEQLERHFEFRLRADQPTQGNA